MQSQAPKAVARVLIADDNLDHVATTALLLQTDGHEVCGVASGEAALEKFEAFAPDVVVVDIGMPRMSGYDTARALRAHRAGSQVLLIALTAYDSYSERLLSKIAGFDYHIAKPADPATLTAIVRAYVASKRSPRIHVIPDMPRR
jgi:DNA-binding response OmpR family regulator